jgi:hypothetical protein
MMRGLLVLVVIMNNFLVVFLVSFSLVLFMMVVSFLPCLMLVKVAWVSYWVSF